MDSELRLYEKTLLLGLKDEKGTMEPGTMAALALGAAILAELFLFNKLRMDGSGRKPMVALRDRARTGDRILDEAVAKVRNAKRRGSAATWVSRFSRIKHLRIRIAEGLVRKGVLKSDERKILFLFTQRIFPEINPEPERALRREIEQAVMGHSTVTPELTVLIALCRPTGLLKPVLGAKALRERKKRLDEIVAGSAVGKAAKDVVQAVQVATMAATMVPIMVATTSH